MRALLISDTHGNHRNLERILEKEEPFDAVFHMGDVEGGELYIEGVSECPVYMVAGNCDFFTELDGEEVVTIEGVTIFMTHGHRYRVSAGTSILKQEAAERGAQFAFYGHTHVPDIDTEDDVVVVNPGSLSFPRQKGRKATYVVMEIDSEKQVSFTLKNV